MIHYFLAFAFPAIMAMLQSKDKSWNGAISWSFVWLLYTLFIGLRDEVGADWGNYWNMFERQAYYMTYSEALHHGDPLYWLLQVWVSRMGWDIHMVNLIGASIFMYGVIRFLRQLPNPWLGMVVVMAYTAIAVAMGYVRQGIALGVIFWAIAVLNEGKAFKFIFLVGVAAAFHKSAVIIAGIGMFQEGRGKYIKSLAALLIVIGIYFAFVSGREQHYIHEYIESGMQSSGAYIRILMNLIPALFFFYFRKTWKRTYPTSYQLWYMISLGSIVALGTVFLASTATDRISLYFIPLQVVVWSRMPILMQKIIPYWLTTLIVILYYAAVYIVFLKFAKWSFAWFPYKNTLLMSLGIQ